MGGAQTQISGRSSIAHPKALSPMQPFFQADTLEKAKRLSHTQYHLSHFVLVNCSNSINIIMQVSSSGGGGSFPDADQSIK